MNCNSSNINVTTIRRYHTGLRDHQAEIENRGWRFLGLIGCLCVWCLELPHLIAKNVLNKKYKFSFRRGNNDRTNYAVYHHEVFSKKYNCPVFKWTRTCPTTGIVKVGSVTISLYLSQIGILKLARKSIFDQLQHTTTFEND